jgi:hypothetical protein
MAQRFEVQWKDEHQGTWEREGVRGHDSLPKARVARDKVKIEEKKLGIRGYKYRIIQIIE